MINHSFELAARPNAPECGRGSALHVAGEDGRLVLAVGIEEVLLAQLRRFRGEAGICGNGWIMEVSITRIIVVVG